MPDSDINQLNAANVNFGTQIFHGAVYIVSPATAGAPAAAPPPLVFLSYARADDGDDYDDPDKSLLRRLTNDLTAAGFAVWWDRVSLPSRSLPFQTEIEAAIAHCDRFLLVAGPGAKDSEWVQAELKCARDHCRPITVMLRGGDFGHIPDGFDKINAIDFRPPRAYAAALDDLLNRLRQPAPVAPLLNVKPLPGFYLDRPAPFKAAHDALCADSIAPAVISAPPRATALFGYGGIGKTTLAAALCHDCEVRRTFDQIHWIDVGPNRRNEQDAAALMRAASGGASDDYRDIVSARQAFAAHLHGKKTLIVLDDVWDVSVAKAFQFGGVDARTLLTTRQKRIVEALGANAHAVDKLTEAEALKLLRTRAGRDLDENDARQVVALLDGHTLAVALAGAWLHKNAKKPAADLLKRLQTRPDFRDLKLDKNDRNLNLERSLRLSYDDLPKAARGHFRAMGVVAPTSTIGAAALGALWGIEDTLDAEDALTVLLDAGLVDEALTPPLQLGG